MERISALMDGEAEGFEAEQVLRQLGQDAVARDQWQMYHLIGDALRSEPVLTRDLTAGVMARLADEPTVLAPRPAMRRALRYALSAAASVAAFAVVVALVMSENPLRPAPEVAQRAASPALVAATPGAAPVLKAIPVESGPVNGYVMAHQEFSPVTAFQGAMPYARTVSVTAAAER